MSHNFRVIVQTFAFGFADDRHHFALRESLLPMILFERIIDSHPIRRFLMLILLLVTLLLLNAI